MRSLPAWPAASNSCPARSTDQRQGTKRASRKHGSGRDRAAPGIMLTVVGVADAADRCPQAVVVEQLLKVAGQVLGGFN